MTTRKRAHRKRRGDVCAGYGRIGKHRKHPGGRGNAGGEHHHKNMMRKYHPGFYGKHGMRYFNLRKSLYFSPSINLDRVWSLVSEQTRNTYATNKTKVPVIDVTKAGYFKVLGRGELPKQPVVVKAKFFSRLAEQKIKAAGGACLLTA